MNKLIFAAGLLTVCTTTASAATDYFANTLAVIKPSHSQVAISAIDLSNNQLIYEHNADTLLLPASTQKLLTAVAAKIQLAVDFSFTTKLYTRGNIRNGKLDGDLYLSFSGDPTLTTDNLRDLFKQLADKGLYEISGDLFLFKQDNEQLQAPGWVWDDLGICFAAPVSRFVINQNCILGQLKPQLASSESRLSFPSYLPASLSTSAKFDKTEQQAFCQLELQRLPRNHFHISGCYPGSESIKLAIAISDPELYAIQTVEQLIKSAQIRVKGKVTSTTQAVHNLRLVGQHQSASLNELLTTMLQKSDNLIADSLFKVIGSSYFNAPGSFTNGAAAVEKLLTEEGIDLSHSQIVDGSGLSRYNLLSANQLVQILQLIYKDKRLQDLIEMLPAAGKSGTLRYKIPYTRAPLKDKVQAKTGSMQGVDNLAGFLSSPGEDDIVFVILENGQSPKSKDEQLAPFNALFLQSLLDNKPPQSELSSHP
ncbi:D-alanyl-D-alanine carboxypeptidase/D-alanyl-D-alanine-endopeptidase [Shewanella sp. Isolate11]|uniref:D-alanyl-D-alanine carboxypeptidase/D-alanyl-D-alanine endopeptidase n=1 Tax=Shewanella sp. Isolate11 TaxID=2908530 RepID=UPI001EFE0625|nr:D-alanyl-D-alanine carboxypeptidase/D-alanyl-D-alanine-endopeptidase [Shewanella sp. Isolate11]MCG9696696.1 D-alanyl-D-alanine carboxypeptidase/D-alanyl-D-alanine-endopeptidase [Shewanella sp. Isolate11]